LRQEHIEAFLEIVKTRNINKAAENLYLSQSTVSHYLKQLEEELELQLIARRKGYRGVELTPYGEEFIPLAEQWVNLKQQMESLKRNPTLELTIGSIDSLNSNILYPVCQKLLSENDDMNIRIRTAQSDSLYKLAMNGEIDIGFVGHDSIKPNVESTFAFSERMCVIRNRGMEEPEIITAPSQLPEEREISLNWSPEYHAWHRRYWDPHIHPHVTTDAISLLRRFMKTGGSWAIVPVIDLKDMENVPFEVCDLGKANPPDRKIFQILPKHSKSHCSIALDMFLDTLHRYVRSNPDLCI